MSGCAESAARSYHGQVDDQRLPDPPEAPQARWGRGRRGRGGRPSVLVRRLRPRRRSGAARSACAHQADPVTSIRTRRSRSWTMVPLSLVYSRLVKVKAGPSVKPMTYPIEPDLAESWTQPNDTTYVFKLKKGVRWHPKPPVNGRELTADDVKYTYERFLTITGNPNKPVLEYVDKIEAVDKYTVKFTLKEPNAWFLDLLASTSTWIIAKECVEKFGDLKKVESVVGTGPWMLERWEPNVKLVYVRNPNYFVPGSALRRWRRDAHRQGPVLAPGHLALRQDRLRPRVPARGALARRAGGPAAEARPADRRVHVVHQRRHRLQARQPAVQRPPGPAGARARHQRRRGVRVARLLPGALDAEPRRPRRLRRVVDPDRSARSRGPEALRVQHRRGQAPAGRGRPSERVQDHGGGAAARVRSRLRRLRGDHDQELEGGRHRRRPEAQGVRGVHLQHDLREVRQHVPRAARAPGPTPRRTSTAGSCPASRSTSGA